MKTEYTGGEVVFTIEQPRESYRIRFGTLPEEPETSPDSPTARAFSWKRGPRLRYAWLLPISPTNSQCVILSTVLFASHEWDKGPQKGGNSPCPSRPACN